MVKKEELTQYFRINPSLLFLLGLLLSLVPLNFEIFYTYSTIIIIISLLALVSFFISKKQAFNLIIWFFIGIGIFYLHSNLFQNNQLNSIKLDNVPIEVKGTFTEQTAVGESVKWLKSPSFSMFNITEYRYENENYWTKTNCNLLVKIKNNNIPIYGTYVEAQGKLTNLQNTGLDTDKIYANYIKSMGVSKILQMDSFDIQTQPSLYYKTVKFLFTLRDEAINLSCKNIDNYDIKTFIAGIMFGCRQGIPGSLTEEFLNSGTIHILSISGLHVGIIALLFLLLFRFIPIRIRYGLIPFILFFYVVIVGFKPPILRAFIMIALFCFNKAFLKSSSGINIVSFAAVLSLLINPFSAINLGFIFSYTVVFFLILSWKKVKEISSSFYEISLWKPRGRHSSTSGFKSKMNNKIILSVLSAIIASLASSGIVAYSQKMIVPLMPIINVLILPFLFPISLLILLKTIFATISQSLANTFNPLIEILINTMFHLIKYSNELASPILIGTIPLWTLIIFYLFLILLFIVKKKYFVFFIFVVIVFTFCYWILNPFFIGNKLTILTLPGDKGNSFIYSIPIISTAYVYSTPPYSSYQIESILKSNAIKKIETLYIPSSSSEYAKDALALIKNIPTSSVFSSTEIRKNRIFKELDEYCRSSNIELKFSNISEDNFSFTNIIYQNKIEISLSEINPGRVRISIKENNINKNEFFILNSNTYQLISIPIN